MMSNRERADRTERGEEKRKGKEKKKKKREGKSGEREKRKEKSRGRLSGFETRIYIIFEISKRNFIFKRFKSKFQFLVNKT